MYPCELLVKNKKTQYSKIRVSAHLLMIGCLLLVFLSLHSVFRTWPRWRLPLTSRSQIQPRRRPRGRRRRRSLKLSLIPDPLPSLSLESCINSYKLLKILAIISMFSIFPYPPFITKCIQQFFYCTGYSFSSFFPNRKRPRKERKTRTKTVTKRMRRVIKILLKDVRST